MHFAVKTAVLILSLTVNLAAQSQQKKEATGSIKGRITMGGKPAPGVSVVLMSGETYYQSKRALKVVTDEEGIYKISGIPPGRYRVVPVAAGLSGASGDRNSRPGKTLSVGDGENID